ncbi:hypothetical protein L6R49_28155 [Myxococcota bacterium]|nr:hypothetical protein [Myxococcota bacterium]
MSAVDLDELRALGGEGLVFWMQRTHERWPEDLRAYAAGYLYELATVWKTSDDPRRRELAEAWLVEYAPERVG